MKIALLLTPCSDHHLKLAAQVGCEEIVGTYPGEQPGALKGLREKVEEHGLALTTIERHIPHDLLVHGRAGQEKQLKAFKKLLIDMGREGVRTLCYNWMPEEDWQRTSITAGERGGALVTEFDLEKVQSPRTAASQQPTPPEALWKNLEAFLGELLPLAEDQGINLAIHPDDPPLDQLHGQDRILTHYEAFERVLNLNTSPANGICFCQGSFASRGENIAEGICRFGDRIKFVHFRDVVGKIPAFRETFHDNGKTDMAEAIRAYGEIGFTGPIRPDHVPTLDGETNDDPGYEMLGRLHAVGYLRGLMDGTAPPSVQKVLPDSTP